jgi:hypothetical protein
MSKTPFWCLVWGHVKTILAWIATRILAPGAFILLTMGCKSIKIGGLLGWLFNREMPKDTVVDVANTIPKGRVDDKGNLIPVGKPDENGNVQVKVVAMEEPGFFSDPTIIKFTPPGEDKSIEVKLPKGVTSDTVDKVVIVKPGVVAVTVKNNGVSTKTVDDLLKKYGG